MDDVNLDNGPLLPKPEPDSNSLHDMPNRRRSTFQSWGVIVLSSSVVSMLLTLLTFYVLFHETSSKTAMLLPSLQVPRLGHLQKVFIGDPIYVQPPSNKSNQAWEDLFPKGKGYVSMQSIQAAGPVPDFVKDIYSDNSGHFCVALFHQLHCLYLIRNGFYQALDGKAADRTGHVLHCFEYLRQSILCAADTTLEPFRSRFEETEGKGVDGMASLHQCRNFDEVYDWAERFRYNDDRGFETFEG